MIIPKMKPRKDLTSSVPSVTRKEKVSHLSSLVTTILNNSDTFCYIIIKKCMKVYKLFIVY